eukprot:286437-Rhodomonas_salina.1
MPTRVRGSPGYPGTTVWKLLTVTESSQVPWYPGTRVLSAVCDAAWPVTATTLRRLRVATAKRCRTSSFRLPAF